MNTFIVTFEPGKAWVRGKGSREQPHWSDHAVFMDNLFSAGKVVMGGPFVDYSGVMVIVLADSGDEVDKMFRDDPFLTNDILKITSITQWLIFLDSRKANA